MLGGITQAVVLNDEKIERDVRKVAYSFIPKIKRLISVKVIGENTYNAMMRMNFSLISSIEKEGVSLDEIELRIKKACFTLPRL